MKLSDRLIDRLSVRELIAKHTWWHRKPIIHEFRHVGVSVPIHVDPKPVQFLWATPDDDVLD